MARSPQPVLLSPQQAEQRRILEVRAMAACGADVDHIAVYLGLPPRIVKAQFSKEIEEGYTFVRYRVETQVALKAMAGNTQCALAWLNQYGGWKQVTRKELTGADGGPISFSSLDAASLDQVIIALRQAEASGGRPKRDNPPQEGSGSGRIIDMESLPGSSDESPSE